MQKATGIKPRLNNLDELFGLNGDIKPSSGPADTEYAILPFSVMDDFPGHPFRLYTGQRKDDMVESIRAHGILQALILRAKEDGRYQVLSGHNRKHSGIDAGLVKAPAIIKRSLTDEVAWVYVIETNLMQRSFGDMLPSEKAAVLALHHSKLFSQGKRNDILAELQILEKPSEINTGTTSVGISQKSGTREALAKEYGLAPFSVAQYLRVFQLTDDLKRLLDNGVFALTSAVALSFLNKNEQQLLSRCLELNGFKLDMKKAAALRRCSEEGKLNDEGIYLILSGKAGQKPKANGTPTVKVSKTVYTKYFKPESAGEGGTGYRGKGVGAVFQPTTAIEQYIEKRLTPSGDGLFSTTCATSTTIQKTC